MGENIGDCDGCLVGRIEGCVLADTDGSEFVVFAVGLGLIVGATVSGELSTDDVLFNVVGAAVGI